MVDFETISSTRREPGSKGVARRLRRDGFVPGIIYGNSEAPIAMAIERRVLSQVISDPRFFIRLVDVEINGTKHRVLPREVQFHPVSDQPMHVDFLRFDPDRKIAVAVPVGFENDRESIGIKRGGILNVVRHEVEVYCTADKIPSDLSVDLEGLDIGDSVRASDITLPEGIGFVISDRDFTVATIAPPTVLAEPTEEEEETDEDAVAAEGEDEVDAEDASEAAGG